MNNSNGFEWPAEVWKEINDEVVKEVMKVRITQKVFPTIRFDTNPTVVTDDVINFDDLSIKEGRTKPFVEIYREFPLTGPQVSKETEYKTCKALARMAAKEIALAEDIIFFQGKDGKLPANVKAELVSEAAGVGLLGEANPKDVSDNEENRVSVPILVPAVNDNGQRNGILYGEHLFSAVANGIAKLTRKAQAPAYALFLPIRAYADTFVPPSPASLVTTAERIKPLVEGGFYGTGTLPEKFGLLVALAGAPTSLYVGREATTEYVRQEGSKHIFRVVERVQYVARDPRAFVLFNLEPVSKGAHVQKPQPKN
jgi:uncharacterized linocin/CFP29 family protein